ncbi:MAG TPA: hypothetical protein VFV72_09960 [Candidatus Limnocylindrales bacterium]|nr:hypothetical protein [Candidatus Limnocylindrales bacterium]
MTDDTDTGKGAGMLAEELLRVMKADRERQIAEAQRARAAAGYGAHSRRGRTWIRDLWAPTPTFGGRPHPGGAATEPTL